MGSNDPIIILVDVPMDEAILTSDEDNDEPSEVIFQTESDEDKVLVNEVNEIEDLNDFKQPQQARNLFPNGRFDVELNETEDGNSGASNDGFMFQNKPEYDFNCERLYIDNERKLYKLLYTTSARMMETHIDDSINQLMKKIPRHDAYRIYQDQLNELSHAKYTMKIEFTNFIKQYSESGLDRIGHIALWHQTLSRKYSHKVLHSNILVYSMHIDTENDSIMNIVIPVRKIRKSKSTRHDAAEDSMQNMIQKLKTVITGKGQCMVTYASSS